MESSDGPARLSARHIRQAAYWVGEEIQRRQRFGHPIPASLRDLDKALNSAVSADGQPDMPVLSRLKTTKQLADEWHCTPRTVRRRAVAAGGRKIHNMWLFDEQETA